MKRFFTFAALIIATASVSFAQTVESSKFFENMYIGVNGGMVTPLENSSVHGLVGLELGKDFTPVVGASIDGNIAFKNGNQDATIQRVNANVNAKVNLSNWIGGYKGFPRRVEVLLVPGFGWEHNRENLSYTNYDENYLTINTFAQINFNLGQKRAWLINIKPGVVWDSYNFAGEYANGIFRTSAADLRITAGVAYRFGSKRTGSHNFVLCPYSVTKADYDKLAAERDALQAELNKGPKVVEKEVIKEKKVEVPVYMPANSFVTFSIGSALVTPVEKIKLKQWVNNVPAENAITVIGSADSKTGSKATNDKLSQKRAEAVKKIIVEECGRDESKVNISTQIDVNPELNAASRAAVIEVIK